MRIEREDGMLVIDGARFDVESAMDRAAEIIRVCQAIDPSSIKLLPPLPVRIHCPMCHTLHIDEGEFATADRPHHTHTCQNCGHSWRDTLNPTIGVKFLPGFQGKPKSKPVPKRSRKK